MEKILLTSIIAAITLILFVRLIALKSKNPIIKSIYRVLKICFVVSVLVIGILSSLILSEVNSVPKNIQEVDYVVILGAGLIGNQPSKRLQLRLDTAINTISNSQIPVIVSGGQGPHETVSEAEAMYRYLKENGIDSSRIILENKSTSTQENIKFSGRIIGDVDTNVLIVTSDYHMYRSKLLAKRFGWKVQGASAKNTFRERTRRMFREVFALMKDIIIQ